MIDWLSHVELQLSASGEICRTLKELEVEKPFQLGVYLRIGASKLHKIEEDHPCDIDRQMKEVIDYWLKNTTDHATWEILAKAVECMDDERNLADRLRNLDSEGLEKVLR